MTQQKLADLDADKSHLNLAPVWDVLGTPIYRVVDEKGVNVACGQIRKLQHGPTLWLYVDDTDGYAVMDDEAAGRPLVVAEEDHVSLGWDRNGNVTTI
jgi:hypothetical protein